MGTEWLVIPTAAAGDLRPQLLQAAKQGGRKEALRPDRLAGGVTCYVAKIVGAVVLILGYMAGLYVAAVGLIISLALLISGAWLLLVAVHEDSRSRNPVSSR